MNTIKIRAGEVAAGHLYFSRSICSAMDQCVAEYKMRLRTPIQAYCPGFPWLC